MLTNFASVMSCVRCVLANKSEAELFKLGECPLDPGGYFIVRVSSGQGKVMARNVAAWLGVPAVVHCAHPLDGCGAAAHTPHSQLKRDWAPYMSYQLQQTSCCLAPVMHGLFAAQWTHASPVRTACIRALLWMAG
jgi:hypothetical protein